MAGLAGCEVTTQDLPFDPTLEGVSVTVGPEGGTVSTAAGASLHFPEGALPSATEVSLHPTPAVPAPGVGTTASAFSFRAEPAGLQPRAPVEAALRIDTAPTGSEWLASVRVDAPDAVHEVGASQVDIATGVVRANVDALGTFSAVIPEPAAVVRAGLLSSPDADAQPSDTPAQAGVDVSAQRARVDCGQPGNRCRGATAGVSANLLELVDSAAIVFPRIRGDVRIGLLSAEGSIELSAPLRFLLRSGESATSLGLGMTASTTPETRVEHYPTHTTLTDIRLVVRTGEQEQISTTVLEIPRSGTGTGTAVEALQTGAGEERITLGGTFEFVNAAGVRDTAVFSVTFPVRVEG